MQTFLKIEFIINYFCYDFVLRVPLLIVNCVFFCDFIFQSTMYRYVDTQYLYTLIYSY